MSIAGIAASSFFSGAIAQSTQNKFQQAQQEFQQLGEDLQAGNLSQAQTDLGTLQKQFPVAQSTSPSSTGSDSLSARAGFQQLSQDLQAGNLTAAQSDYATLRQDAQPPGTGSSIHSHHHARHGEESTANPNSIAQVLSQLGQALQTSNLSAAQQSYSTLLQDFQTGAGSALDGGVAVSPGTVSFSA